MIYRLRYDRRFWRQLETLPGDVRSIARRRIRSLTCEPQPARAKELSGHPGYYRLWLPRGHRLVWQVIEDEGIVDLIYIGPKAPDLYTRLGLGR